AAFAGEVEAALAGGEDRREDRRGHRPAHKPAHVLGADARVAPACPDLAALMARASGVLDGAPAAAGDDCFWLYSSGSTGRPKAAVHAHRDMVVTSQLYGVGVLGVTESDISFSSAKLFFAYGLGNAMTFPLWTGSTAILDDRRPT